MDFVRHHLAEAIALSRPELAQTQQQCLVDQALELIGSTNLEARAGPLQMIATGEVLGSPTRARGHEYRGHSELSKVAFAIGCQQDGRIEEVFRDGLGLGPRFASGTMLAALVSRFHSRKAGRFLRDVRKEGVLFDCPLIVLGPSGKVRLFWSAMAVESRTIVIGTKEALSLSVPEELARLAEEQPDAFEPFLVELARWRKRNTSAIPIAPDDPRPGARDPSPEAHAAHHGVPGRRRLLELAAHDLCNPISAIVAACEYLIEDAAGVLEPRHTLFLCSIAASSRKALKLVQDMGEIPRIRLDKPTLELKPTDIVSLVQQELASLRSLANDMKVTMALNITRQMPSFSGDPARLGQALHGLMINAIGPAAIEGRIEIDIAGGAENVSVALRRVFLTASREPSPQILGRKNPRRLSDVYSALLLAQARSIVNAHGGVLRVESHGKHGPSWTVTLPAAADAGCA